MSKYSKNALLEELKYSINPLSVILVNDKFRYRRRTF